MILSIPEINIKSSSKHGSDFLEFLFVGRFTKEACYLTTKAWANEFKKRSASRKYTIVLDFTKIRGFDITSRNEIIRHMGMFEDRITKVIAISDNQLLRESVQSLLNSFSFDTLALDSESRIHKQRTQNYSENEIASDGTQPSLAYTISTLFSVFVGVFG